MILFAIFLKTVITNRIIKKNHAQMCSGFNDCGISLTTTERRNTLIRTYSGKTFTVGDLTRCRSPLVSLEQNRELFLFNMLLMKPSFLKKQNMLTSNLLPSFFRNKPPLMSHSALGANSATKYFQITARQWNEQLVLGLRIFPNSSQFFHTCILRRHGDEWQNSNILIQHKLFNQNNNCKVSQCWFLVRGRVAKIE